MALMIYPLTPEQAALYAVARTTWRRRGTAKARGLTFGEESVTDTILMDLAETFPGSLTILPFSKHEEGKRGADWAWLFRDASGAHNLPMLVQAKALDLVEFEYPEIKRHIGKITPPMRQIDRLIETAQAWGWPAIYAFYNHLDNVSRIPSACGSLPASDAFGHIPESWGVSIANAYTVRDVLDDQTFDTHRMHSKPLHCLLCSGGRGVRPAGGSPALAFQSLTALPRRGEAGPEPRLFPQPPELFQRALLAASEGDRRLHSTTAEALGRDNPELAGVVILQDAWDSPPEP
jgi:hypothetical protein